MKQASTQEAVREPFTIDSKEKAAWAMRKLHQIRAKQAENTDVANSVLDKLQKEIDEVKGWLEAENSQLENNEARFFVSALGVWFKQQQEADPKLKTIKLPFGLVKIRKQRPEFKLDDVALLSWAKSSVPKVVKAEESVNWAELKKQVKVVNGKAVLEESGEVVGGVQVEERPPVLSVEVDV